MKDMIPIIVLFGIMLWYVNYEGKITTVKTKGK